ncbi:hypothetical protein E1H12_05660 [Geitlerinema sp. P-1104]|uniref:hypothetical protein n=1 Tax=Geitlerinema sp. P-1104 TaxID=2546230 RepID=UPI001476C4C5|nr:hypothetical protein [Geitlerinema sp. P-1104]NMG58026.1 hypothetical protein [Geitlerinema sp. P-1104]
MTSTSGANSRGDRTSTPLETQPENPPEDRPLIYPTLDGLLYDVRETLGQSDAVARVRRRQFWQKVYGDIPDDRLDALQQNEHEDGVNALLPDTESLYWQTGKPNPREELDGFIYPFGLEDIYGLQLETSGRYLRSPADAPSTPPQINDNPRPLAAIDDLKQQILAQLDPEAKSLPTRRPERYGSLGETWFIWAKQTDGRSPQDLAQDIYARFLNLDAKDIHDHLTLTGSINYGNKSPRFFEFEKTPTFWQGEWHEFLNRYPHVCVLLFPESENIEEIRNWMAKFANFNFIRWFGFRNKVRWAKWNSRQLKAELKGNYATVKRRYQRVRDRLNSKPVNLAELQKDLTQCLSDRAEYAEKLVLLDAQQHAIAINARNYEQRQRRLGLELQRTEHCNWNPDRDIEQIQFDRDNLETGLTLLDHLIRNIEGVIQIEQTRGDRALNQTVGMAGVGLATGAIAVAVATTHPQQPPKPRDIVTAPAFWWSLLMGIGFSLLVAILQAIAVSARSAIARRRRG